MNLFSPIDILSFIAWFLALVELILGLYILLLNARHPANRHVGALLLLFSVNSYALGSMIGATNAAQAELSSILLAATSAAAQPALLLVATVLLKPEWLPRSITGGALQGAQDKTQAKGWGRWRWVWWLVYGLAFLPLALTMIDVAFNAQLWYTGLDAATYAGGYVERSYYTDGILSPIIRMLNIYVMGLTPLIPILYVLIFDRKAARGTRQLAWLLLATQLMTLAFQFGLRNLFGAELSSLLSVTILVFGYAYAGFRQMISERRAQRGRLQTRLTLLLMVVTIPLLVAVVLLLSARATTAIEQKADEQLAATNRAVKDNASIWLHLNVNALNQLVTLPDIVSMDPQRQKPVLELMDDAYQHLFLIQTTDPAGINVARNDDQENKDYSDRIWYLGAISGAPITLQSLVSRTTGEPALNLAAPIRDSSGEIIGVGSIVSELGDLSQEVQVSKVGESGFAYIVDTTDRVVAHPDPAFSAELRELGTYPPIAKLRQGTRGLVAFTDEQGQRWQAYVDEMDNGWGVVVQQLESELLRPIQALQIVSWAMIGLGALMLVTLTTLTIRQSVQPIGTLTDTATAIAGGDLDRVAEVESEDEIGALARAFNSMTEQLRTLIGSLEDQVSERTQDLAQRTAYLEATADVGRAAASILDSDQLIQQVVELVRERFDLYYVGLFQVETAGAGDGSDARWAVLRAGTGAAGQAMLARGHRIQVGSGMVGWAVAYGESRLAIETGEDAVHLATPELPDTRSEAALPLRSRGRVLGALTVQHTEPDAFDEATMAVLQTMADQVAVALDNAQLFAESESALERAQRAFGEVSRQAWLDLLRTRSDWGYRYTGTQQAVVPASGEWHPGMVQAQASGQTVQPELSTTDRQDGNDDTTLAIPLRVRDQVVGVLGFRKGQGQTWTAEETELLESFSDQLESALESARLYEETQHRAAREQLTSQITARMRETLNVDMVLQTAAREIGESLGLHDLTIRLAEEEPHRQVPRRTLAEPQGGNHDGDEDQAASSQPGPEVA